MLKELADLLKSKETIAETTINDLQETSVPALSKSEIDSILHHSWEISISDSSLSRKETEQGLKASQTAGYIKGIATAIRNKAYHSMLKSEYKQSLEEAKTSLGIIDEEDSYLAGTAWDISALSYNGLGIYEKAVEHTYRSLTLFEKSGYARGIAWAHHNLAMVYSNIGELDKSEQEYKKALNSFHEINFVSGISRVCTLLSQLNQRKKLYEKSMEYLVKAEKYIDLQEINVSSFSLCLNKAITKRLLKDLPGSEKEFDRCFNIRSHIENNELAAQYVYERSLLLKDQNRQKEACDHLLKAYDLAVQINSKMMKKNITHALSAVYENMGHEKEALKYYKMYDKISDELMNNESIQRIHNLEVRKDIELAEKEKDFHRKLQEETEKILKNVLPVPIVEELKTLGYVKPKTINSATALFTDFVGFTAISSRISAEEIVEQLDYCFSGFDKIMEELGIEKLKTIGDGYMAVAGSLTQIENHAGLCVQAGLKIRDFMEQYIKKRTAEGKESWNVRIGIHTGKMIAGVIGSNKFAYDVWGDTVNTASRIESGGKIGRVNISSHVHDIIKDQFNCISAGEVQAKGKGMLPIFIVEEPK